MRPCLQPKSSPQAQKLLPPRCWGTRQTASASEGETARWKKAETLTPPRWPRRSSWPSLPLLGVAEGRGVCLADPLPSEVPGPPAFQGGTRCWGSPTSTGWAQGLGLRGEIVRHSSLARGPAWAARLCQRTHCPLLTIVIRAGFFFHRHFWWLNYSESVSGN